METNKTSFVEKVVLFAFSNRVLVISAVVLLSVLGLFNYAKMSRNVYPEITIPVFTIVTENEVMAPEEIEMMITRPMESAMNGLPGVKRIRSQTTQGLSTVVVEFELSSEFWRSRQFVSERISQVVPTLPPGTEPPNLSNATTRLAEVCEISLESADMPLTELREIAEWQVRYTLLTVPGVAEVLNMGGKLRQFNVLLDPEKMKACEITLSDVETALTAGSENAAGGFITVGPSEYNVRSIGRYTQLADIENTLVRESGSVPVFIGDIAQVEDSFAIRRGIATKNGREAVVAILIKQPDADTVQVMEGVKKALDGIRETLPENVTLSMYYDQTVLIDSSLKSVIEAIALGALLVIAVLLLFMGSFRSTLIVSLSIPLSVLLAGNIMKLTGVGLNTMSLGGLAIAVGIMVDASIIMVENIHHRLTGNRDRDTVVRSATGVARPIAGATAVIISVFLPLFMMEGMEGLLFRPLAVTVTASLFCALVIALCFTPVLAGRFLQAGKLTESKAVLWLKKFYAPILEWSLAHKTGVVVLSFLLMIPSFAGLFFVGRNFMPSIDEGAWVISTVTAPETSLEENNRITSMIEEILLKNENVVDVVRRNGRSERAIGCVLPVNSGEIIVNFKPRGQRAAPMDGILQQVRDEVEEIPGLAVAFTQPLQLKIDESMEGTPSPLQVKLFGPDINVLNGKGAEIEAAMREVPGLEDINRTQAAGIPQLQIVPDREEAARYGVSIGDLSETVRLAVGGEELSQLWISQRSYGVFVRMDDSWRASAEAIGLLPVARQGEGTVPLARISRIDVSHGPNVIWREAMNRMITINASIAGRDLSSVVDDIKGKMEAVSLPADYFVVYGGQYENQQRAMTSLLFTAAVSLVIVFIIIWLVLGSVRDSAAILVSVPSALIGSMVFLLLARETLNVSSAVGFIAVFGIAVQNSLVLFSQIAEFRQEGHGVEDSVRLASVQRLRPKLMTVLCTALGLLPILLGNSAGSEIEKPLAVVVIGGLITSTLFTLLVLPALYLLIEKKRPPAEGV